MHKLEGLQNLFLKVILDSPSTTPNCAGVWDTAMTGMRFRIMKRKLRFINFIKKCDDSFLAKQIYQEQLKHNWPGLTQEAREMCVLLDLPDITKVAVSNQEIENKVRNKNKLVLIAEMTNLSKMKDLVDEEFEIKEYLSNKNVTEARVQFSQRCGMFRCKWNYRNDQEYKEDLWKCDSCQSSIDTMAHVLICPAYQPLRRGKNMENESDVLSYLVAVNRIRAKIGLTR